MTNKILRLTFFFLAISLSNSAQAQSAWQVEKGRSSVQFKVKHFVLSTVKGKFTEYDGSVSIPEDGDLTKARLTAEVAISSVYTGNEDRDSHLLKEEFFHVAEHPTMKFESTSVSRTGKNTYDMHGTLSIRGVSKPVIFKLVDKGLKELKDGSFRAKFNAAAKISRYDYGLKWNDVTEAGGIVVDENVDIILRISLKR